MISVIMPVRNRANLVSCAIKSVIAQTFKDYELLIIDDGSDDNLEQVVTSYLSDKIILHRIPKSGVSHARNFGIQKARYPILAYLDSDNQWHPDFLKTMYNAIKGIDSKYAAAYCLASQFSRNNNGKIAISGIIGEPFSFKKLLAGNYIDINTFVHTKNLFNHTDLFDINLKRLVDWDIILRITSLAKPIFVPAVLVDYYHGIVENTISRNENLEHAVNIIKSKYAAQTGPFTFVHDSIPYVWGDLNEKKHHNFWLHLNQQKLNTIDYSAWGYPFMLQIEPTNACNLECPLCPVGRKELKRKTQHMTFEMFKSIIDDMQDYLLFLVLWDWGEPLMNPQLPKMIRYASERDIRTVTSTNGHFLNNEDYMQQLLTSGLTTLIVAIDSLDEESYKIYRKEGSLSKAVRGLKNVVKMKKRLGSKTLINLRMVVMKQNEHELSVIRKLAHKIGVDWFSVKTLNPSCGSLAMDSDLVPTNPKYQRFEYDPQTHRRIRIDSVCRRPWEMANIFSNGDVVPCCYDFDATMKLGNVMETPFTEIWNCPAYSRLRQKIYNQKDSVEKCRNCWISFKLSKNAWFPEYLDLTTRLTFVSRIKRNVKEQLKKTPGKMIIFTLGRAVRKVSKALYFAFTDFAEFRSRLSAYMKTKKKLHITSSAISFERAPVKFLLKRTIRRLAYALTVFSDKYNTRPTEYIGNVDVLNGFLSRCRGMDKPRVLEMGTKRSIPDRSTRHDHWVPNAGEYLGSDIESGVDVQVVVDAHRLSEVVGEKQFDIIISCSTFEHLKYPHLAAHQLMKVLKIGGVLYIQTHQSFPLHAYPYDYFRFSREALAGLFGTKMGFRIIATGYSIPLSLYSPDLLDRDAPAFANVQLYGEKIGETPNDYVYEFDCNI